MSQFNLAALLIPLLFAAIVSFKEQVEALQELDPSVEILVRLLSAVPGWNEKNVQVYSSLAFISVKRKLCLYCVVECKHMEKTYFESFFHGNHFSFYVV